MNNCKELRDALAEAFDDLKSGKIKPHEAAEFANIAGKMIASAKVQVAYYELTGESPMIAFLEEPNGNKS